MSLATVYRSSSEIATSSKDKLAKALETAETLLRKKGISFDAEEMMVLIEAAVAEFNEAFKAPLLEAATADATRRAYDGPLVADSVGE